MEVKVPDTITSCRCSDSDLHIVDVEGSDITVECFGCERVKIYKASGKIGSELEALVVASGREMGYDTMLDLVEGDEDDFGKNTVRKQK